MAFLFLIKVPNYTFSTFYFKVHCGLGLCFEETSTPFQTK